MPKKSAKDREEELKVWESTPVYLTPEGLEDLKAKLERLRKRIPELVHEVARTAAYGDRSENDEYKTAKGRLRATQFQIAKIDDQLRKVRIIPSGSGALGRIQLGSTVKVRSKDKEMTFRIVGTHEANPPGGRISHESPLGAALIGHAKGDRVQFKTATGIQEYFVLEIE